MGRALAIAIFLGVFVALLIGLMAYRYFFDRETWDKALDDARAAGAESRAKSQVKLDARRKRIAQKALERAARSEEKRKEVKEDGLHEKTPLRAKERALEEDRRGHEEDRRRSSARQSGKSNKRRRAYREDPLTGVIIGGLAAVSLVDDIRENHEHDEDDYRDEGETDYFDTDADDDWSSGADGDW